MMMFSRVLTFVAQLTIKLTCLIHGRILWQASELQIHRLPILISQLAQQTRRNIAWVMTNATLQAKRLLNQCWPMRQKRDSKHWLRMNCNTRKLESTSLLSKASSQIRWATKRVPLITSRPVSSQRREFLAKSAGELIAGIYKPPQFWSLMTRELCLTLSRRNMCRCGTRTKQLSSWDTTDTDQLC